MSEKDQQIELSLNQQLLPALTIYQNNNNNENKNATDNYYCSDAKNTVDNSNIKMSSIKNFNSQNDNKHRLNGDNNDQMDIKQPQTLIHEQNVICDKNQHFMVKENSLSFINQTTTNRSQDYPTSNFANNENNAQKNSNDIKENTKDHCVDVQSTVITNTNNNQKISGNNFSQNKNNNRKIVDTKRSPESIDSSSIIQRLLDKIECLECEVARLQQENDALYTENDRLCFQLQMINEADKHQQRHTIDNSYPLIPSNDPNSKFNFNNKACVECHCMNRKEQHSELALSTPASAVPDQYTELPNSMPTTTASTTEALVNLSCSSSLRVNNPTQPISTICHAGNQNQHFQVANQYCNLNNEFNCTCISKLLPFPNNNSIATTTPLVSNPKNVCTILGENKTEIGGFERSVSIHSTLSQHLPYSPTNVSGISDLFDSVANGMPLNSPTGSSNLVRTTRATGGSTTSLASNSNNSPFNYEISQQLIDKKVSALERKYGGSPARTAAIKIQRAFRSYRLKKRFTSLAIQAIQQKQTLQLLPATFNKKIVKSQTKTVNNEECHDNDENRDELDDNDPIHNTASTSNHQSYDSKFRFISPNYYYGEQQYLAANSPNDHNKINICRAVGSSGSRASCVNNNNNQRTISNMAAGCYAGTLQSANIIEADVTVEKKVQKKTSFSSTSSTGSSSSLHIGSAASSKPYSDRTLSHSSKLLKDAHFPINNNNQNQQLSHLMKQPQSHDQQEQNLQHYHHLNQSLQHYHHNLHQQQHHKQARNIVKLFSQTPTQQQSCTLVQSQPQQHQLSMPKTNLSPLNSSSANILYNHHHNNFITNHQNYNISGPNNNNNVHYHNEYSGNVGMTTAVTNEYLCANMSDVYRKRLYRIGLNIFNQAHLDRGLRFLISNNFIEELSSPEEQARAIANFLFTRKGVSRQMIGEYLSDNNKFNQLVLKAFASEINLQGLIVDEALRLFQINFRFPGEAQKIERLVEAFADRYKECNPNDVLSRDSVFILAFAIIMLNTDLHKPTNIKYRMTPEQFLNNLKGVFAEGDLASPFLLGIYKRIKKQELQTGPDHVTQVLKVQSTIVGKDVPNLSLPHRRLVCYCRLYEIRDINRKEKAGQHQREVFLFNDLLLITKTTNRSRTNQLAEYQYRSCTPLDGLHVSIFSKNSYSFGIRIIRKIDQKPIALFNARNELDQKRFVEDLRESIAEMDEMEQIRITKSSSLVHLNNFMLADNNDNNDNKNTNENTNASGSNKSNENNNIEEISIQINNEHPYKICTNTGGAH